MLNSDAKLILADMRNGHPHGAWDWEADARFARDVNDVDAIKFFRELLRSHAPHVHQIAAHKVLGKPIKERRLRAVRQLVKAGYVDSWWLGTGPGGMSEFGVKRNRYYVLRKEYESSPSKPNSPSGD